MKKAYGRRPAQSGFTLVELSVVLIISGLVTAILFEALHFKIMQDSRQATMTAMDNLEMAYTEFVGTYGRYPCPARMNIAPGAAGYGVEDCVNTVIVGPGPGFPVGNHQVPAPAVMDSIMIGDIPITTMAPLLANSHLRGVSTVDGWGNRIQYAVTTGLTATNLTNFDPSRGAIDVVDENAIDVLKVPNTAHMVLISFGDDGRGGNTAAGVPTAPACGASLAGPPPPPPAPVPAAANELENCDNNNSTFLDGIRILDKFSYNDDIVRFETIQIADLWNVVGTYPPGSTAGTPGTYNQLINANTGNVGIGTDTPAANMEVAGTVGATQIQANQFCDQGGQNCLLAEKIGNPDTNPATNNMVCPAGQAIDYIQFDPAAAPNPRLTWASGDITVHCAQIFAGPVAAGCPLGQYMNAVSNLGNVKCITFP